MKTSEELWAANEADKLRMSTGGPQPRYGDRGGKTQSLARVTVISFVILHSLAAGQTALPILGRQISSYAVENENLSGIAIKLGSQTGVPIGLEVFSNDGGTKLDVSQSASTLGAELDRLVKLNPLYKWKVMGKAIDIEPSHNPDSLLDVRINQFTQSDADSGQMLSRLLEDESVKDFLKARGMKALFLFNGILPKTKGNITVRHVALREALNEALVQTHGAAWIAIHADQKTVLFNVF